MFVGALSNISVQKYPTGIQMGWDVMFVKNKAWYLYQTIKWPLCIMDGSIVIGGETTSTSRNKYIIVQETWSLITTMYWLAKALPTEGTSGPIQFQQNETYRIAEPLYRWGCLLLKLNFIILKQAALKYSFL